MAIADDVVQLPVVQLEKALCLAVCIVFQTRCAQHWIFESNRNCGSLAPHHCTCFGVQMFGACKRAKASLGITLQQFSPALYALISCHCGICSRRFNLGDGMQLVECLMFHGQLLLRQRSAHAFKGITAP